MKVVSLIALQLACVNVRWIQKIKRGFCREDMLHVLAGDVLIECPPPHPWPQLGKRGVTTVASFSIAIVVLLLQYYCDYLLVIAIYI